MFKSIDDIMYINDGIDPFKKYTLYNNMKIYGGTIMNGHYVGLDKSELDKLNEDELRKIINQNYNFFNLIDGDENEEQLWVKKQIEDETKYIENILEKKEMDELLEDQDNINKNNIIDDEEYYRSKDFLDQIKWYENNYDNLDEDELYIYLESLAKLKELENKTMDKKNINKTTDLDIKLFNAIKDYELLTGIDSGLQYIDQDEIIEDINEYLKPDDIIKEIKKINTNEGYGKRFEKFIIKIQDRVKRNLTKDKSKLINNDTLKKYSKKKVYLYKGEDDKGKKIFDEKPLSDFLVFDLSQDKNDIELKYYNTGTYMPNNKEIEKNGLILQQSKFINTNFEPLYTIDDKGKTKLYNIYSKKTNDYVNDTYNKDVYILYQTPSGNYSYHLNDDKDLIKVKHPKKGINGEELYILMPPNNYKSGIDNHNSKIIYIPYNKLKKVYL